uniref:Uncharacterized protein n=1 Tax=Solanum tuberosum TaxID=4113 RepID=M0ZYA9_SOLTU
MIGNIIKYDGINICDDPESMEEAIPEVSRRASSIYPCRTDIWLDNGHSKETLLREDRFTAGSNHNDPRELNNQFQTASPPTPIDFSQSIITYARAMKQLFSIK